MVTSAPNPLGERFRTLPVGRLLRSCAGLRGNNLVVIAPPQGRSVGHSVAGAGEDTRRSR